MPKTSCRLPHQATSSSTPATRVPATDPAAVTADQTATAKARRCGG